MAVLITYVSIRGTWLIETVFIKIVKNTFILVGRYVIYHIKRGVELRCAIWISRHFHVRRRRNQLSGRVRGTCYRSCTLRSFIMYLLIYL